MGTMAEDSWTDKEGNKRSTYELKADHIGATVFTLAKKAPSVSSNADNPWN